jgi:hypothetical protein
MAKEGLRFEKFPDDVGDYAVYRDKIKKEIGGICRKRFYPEDYQSFSASELLEISNFMQGKEKGKGK